MENGEIALLDRLWLCIQSQPEIGREENGTQALLQAVKQLCVWLKTTLSWNINIPAGSCLAFSPYCFTGSHDGPRGASSSIKVEEEEKVVLWLGRNIGNGTFIRFLNRDTVGRALTGKFPSEYYTHVQIETHSLKHNYILIQLWSYIHSFGNCFCYLWWHCIHQSNY